MSDTSKTHHSSVTTPLPTCGVDIYQSSHGSVPPIQIVPPHRHRRLYDRVLSFIIGPHTEGGMSLLRFIVMCFFLSLALPFIVIIMVVLGIMYGAIYLVYLPWKCLTEWMRYKGWKKKQEEVTRVANEAHDIWEDDKDMVTKDMECQLCGIKSDIHHTHVGVLCRMCYDLNKAPGQPNIEDIFKPWEVDNKVECQYCGSHEHVTTECPHMYTNQAGVGVTQ